ncbi:MAG: Hpt domain-containing protein [Candidatus Melainabacteria bacterium]|nr:Hpt domain-containing protein [Candidatus Melainabacteria bacterium]
MNSPSQAHVEIEKLEEEFDVETAKELAAAFLEDTNDIVAKIENALAQGDLETCRKHAHMLKGCCRVIMANKCEKIASDLEALVSSGKVDDAKNRLPELSQAFTETEEFLGHYLE